MPSEIIIIVIELMFLGQKHIYAREHELYCYINIRSEFSIKIRARPLVKIDHVIFIYVTTPHSESAVLAITHENRALLQMASRFAQVGEEEISQIISDLCTGYL